MRIVKQLIMFAFGFGLGIPLLNCGGGTTALTPQPPTTLQSCAGAPVSVTGAPGSIYTIPSGATGRAAQCQAAAAYEHGQIVVAYGDSTTLAAALGESPWSEQEDDHAQQFPHTPPVNNGVPISDLTSAPLSDAITTDPVTVYAAYYDVAGDAPVEFSSTAQSMAAAQTLVAAWAAAAPTTSAAARRPQADLRLQSLTAPSYDTRAWAKVLEESWQGVVDNSAVNGARSEDKHPQGYTSGLVTMYRLNTNDNANDYFLVDVTYAQGPNLVYCNDLFTCAWFNDIANATASLTGGRNNSLAGTLVDLSPTTIVSKTEETLSVGGKLSGKVAGGEKGAGGEVGGEVSVGWSRKITTESVDTTNSAGKGVGTAIAGWNDKYNHNPPFNFPNTSKSTYTADRLAIFSIPRAIYDNTPGVVPTVTLTVYHKAQFHGWWFPQSNEWDSWREWTGTFRVPLPIFKLQANPQAPLTSALSLDLKRGTSATFNVVANVDPGQKTLKWFATKTPSFVTTTIDPNGETGNQTVTVNASPNAAVNSVDYLLLNTIPAGGADTLRTGSMRVQITITS